MVDVSHLTLPNGRTPQPMIRQEFGEYLPITTKQRPDCLVMLVLHPLRSGPPVPYEEITLNLNKLSTIGVQVPTTEGNVNVRSLWTDAQTNSRAKRMLDFKSVVVVAISVQKLPKVDYSESFNRRKSKTDGSLNYRGSIKYGGAFSHRSS